MINAVLGFSGKPLCISERDGKKMNFFDVLSLLGGLAMFLYGMRLMGDSLKENSSGTLKHVMEKVTDNPLKAFILGIAVTALIQSSTATIVITSGLVAAGILTLHQSLGIIIGANVGTTVTGQIIRLLDLNTSGDTSFLRIFKPSTLAPIALIIGIGSHKSTPQFIVPKLNVVADDVPQGGHQGLVVLPHRPIVVVRGCSG